MLMFGFVRIGNSFEPELSPGLNKGGGRGTNPTASAFGFNPPGVLSLLSLSSLLMGDVVNLSELRGGGGGMFAGRIIPSEEVVGGNTPRPIPRPLPLFSKYPSH